MNNLTFGGYPIVTEKIGGEIYITVKNVTGTLNQIETYINTKSKVRHYFGKSKIRCWEKGTVKIDCLVDSREHVKELIKLIKEEYNAE